MKMKNYCMALLIFGWLSGLFMFGIFENGTVSLGAAPTPTPFNFHPSASELSKTAEQEMKAINDRNKSETTPATVRTQENDSGIIVTFILIGIAAVGVGVGIFLYRINKATKMQG